MGGYPKIEAVPGYAHTRGGRRESGRDGTVRKNVGDFLYTLHTYYSSVSTRLPKILDCSFELGLRTTDFGKGRPYGVSETRKDR